MRNPRRFLSLRSFVTVIISLIVTVILLCTTLFFYFKTSSVLTKNYKESITNQLSQVNQQFTDQIDSIDSIIPLFLSNTMILDALESGSSTGRSSESQFLIERQMSYIYYSTSLASKNLTNCIYIICADNTIFSTYTSGALEPLAHQSQEISDTIDKTETRLMCRILQSDDNSLYFMRNLFNGNTGKYMGTFVITIDRNKWINYCIKGLDPAWFICLFNQEANINILSDPKMEPESIELQKTSTFTSTRGITFQELSLCENDYFIAAQNLSKVGLTSAVCAPKDLLFKDLEDILQSYLILLAFTVLVALFAAIVISRAITRPIDKMIYQIDQISNGKQTSLPPMKMYYEFEVWADSFNQMLKQLDSYYTDIFQQKLLLKNSEIRALQAQMDPHFLFNVLNTIAWKAEMNDNEEIYQMIISLGELLKMNTLSKQRDFIKLEQEIEYVKFYIYLQQMRFEDKISCSIRVPDSMLHCMIPCFCIQPLVENAIVHGLEPKKGKGQLILLILESGDFIDVSIIDNGVGFQSIPDIRSIQSSDEDEHTHIGLRNLDKRLELLFGEESRLRIDSIPNKCTTISFKIPFKGGRDQ